MLRNFVINTVDTEIQTNQSVNTMSTYFGDIEPFQKGSEWSVFSNQLEAFISLNDVPEQKKSRATLDKIFSGSVCRN